MTDGLSFPYLPTRTTHGDVILRSQLPLKLIYRNKTLDVVGLLDSGADVNVLPYRTGIELGLQWSEQLSEIQLSGNLAQVPARGVVLDARIGNLHPVRLAFARTRSERVPLLLGQVNFFAEYDVCFYRSRRTFEVRPRSGSAPDWSPE